MGTLEPYSISRLTGSRILNHLCQSQRNLREKIDNMSGPSCLHSLLGGMRSCSINHSTVSHSSSFLIMFTLIFHQGHFPRLSRHRRVRSIFDGNGHRTRNGSKAKVRRLQLLCLNGLCLVLPSRTCPRRCH